jgi:methyl-accepting chemotaxis protein
MTMKFESILNSISKKFLFPTILLAIILFGGLGMFMSRSNGISILSMMESKGDAVASFVSRVSAEYFAIFDFSDFENFVKALESDPEVDFAVFYNAEKVPMTSLDKVPEDSSSLMIHERKITDESGATLGYVEVGYNKTSLSKNLKNSFIIISSSTIVALLILALGLIVLVRLVITNRVKETAGMLKDIAQHDGDLTKRLKLRGNDELGELAKWFNKFVGNIHDIITTVQLNADGVASASNELSSTADNLNNGSSDQRLQTEQIASAMTEMSQSIVDVVKNAAESADESGKVAEFAGKGKDVVQKTLEGMEKIAASVIDTSLLVENLGKSSAEIGDILNVINDIAEQTNLLALNAAIEAARAGEQGRGFSVVANEVKKLAENTGTATKEISVMISNIQKDTEKSVTAMNAGKEEVEHGVQLAEEAKEALDEIVAFSEKAAETVRLISVTAEEQSTSTEQVSENMEGILVITQQSADATTQIKTSSEELGKLSSELRSRIGFFKV